MRHGYAHVANNYYQGWTQYAIGGSMSPRVKSESNYFVAPKSGSKEVLFKSNFKNTKLSLSFISHRTFEFNLLVDNLEET